MSHFQYAYESDPNTPIEIVLDIPEQLCDVVELAAIPVGPVTVKEKSFFASLREKLKPPVPDGSGLDTVKGDR